MIYEIHVSSAVSYADGILCHERFAISIEPADMMLIFSLIHAHLRASFAPS